MPYIIGKPIEGISLNGLEYILDDNGHVITFDSVKTANSYLLEHGLSQKEIDDVITITTSCTGE